MTSYGHQARAGFLWGLLGRGSSTIIGLVTSVIVARLLTPYDFGVAAAAMFFVQIAQRATNLGFNTALIRLPSLRPDHAAVVFTVNLILGLTGWLLLALCAPWLAEFYRSPETAHIMPIAGFMFAIGTISTVPDALLARQLRFRASAIIDSLYITTVGLVGIAFAWYGFGYWSLINSLLAGTLIDTALKSLWAQWRPSLSFSRRAFQDLWSFGAGVHLKRLLEAVALNIDNVVVGRALGVGMLGVYDRAFTTMNRVVTLVSSAGQTVSISILGRIQEDPHRFRLAFRNISLGIALVGYPTFALLALVAKPLFLLLFGPQWSSAAAPFQVLCAAGALKLYVAYLSAAVQAKGRVWGEVWRQSAYVGMIVLGSGAGSLWGLVGAAMGVLVATAGMTILMGDLLRRVGHVSWIDQFVPQLAGITCAVGIVLTVNGARALGAPGYTASAGPLLELMAAAGLGGLFASGFLLFCPFPEARRLVREMVAELQASLRQAFRLRAA